jgi:hypothetical protein
MSVAIRRRHGFSPGGSSQAMRIEYGSSPEAHPADQTTGLPLAANPGRTSRDSARNTFAFGKTGKW